MSFLQRFKGKTSVIDKQGIDGIVKSKALPIQKEFSNQNIDMSNQQNKRINKTKQEPTVSQLQKIKKIQSQQSYEFEQQTKPETKIITNIGRPSNQQKQSQIRKKIISYENERDSPKSIPVSQSSTASSNKFSIQNDQNDNFFQSVNNRNTNLPKLDMYAKQQNSQIYSSNNLNNYSQINDNNQIGSYSLDLLKLRNQRSKPKSADDYSNIFQNRLPQRIFSGDHNQQQAQSLIQSSNYENQHYHIQNNFSTRRDLNQMNFNDSYKLPVNQIIVPADYELIAVPRNQMINISSPNGLSSLQNIHNFSSIKLPSIQSDREISNRFHKYFDNNQSKMLPYSPKQVNFYVSDNQAYNNENNNYDNGVSLIQQKKNLINNGRQILESSPNMRQKALSQNQYKYELDLMEEKHRDIILNLEKIREIRTKI